MYYYRKRAKAQKEFDIKFEKERKEISHRFIWYVAKAYFKKNFQKV